MTTVQRQALSRAPDAWEALPGDIHIATVRALRRRGLIECCYRDVYGLLESSWRITPQGRQQRGDRIERLADRGEP